MCTKTQLLHYCHSDQWCLVLRSVSTKSAVVTCDSSAAAGTAQPSIAAGSLSCAQLPALQRGATLFTKLFIVYFRDLRFLECTMHMDNISPTLQGNQVTVGIASGHKRGTIVCECKKLVIISVLGLMVVIAIILIATLVMRNL